MVIPSLTSSPAVACRLPARRWAAPLPTLVNFHFKLNMHVDFWALQPRNSIVTALFVSSFAVGSVGCKRKAKARCKRQTALLFVCRHLRGLGLVLASTAYFLRRYSVSCTADFAAIGGPVFSSPSRSSASPLRLRETLAASLRLPPRSRKTPRPPPSRPQRARWTCLHP